LGESKGGETKHQEHQEHQEHKEHTEHQEHQEHKEQQDTSAAACTHGNDLCQPCLQNYLRLQMEGSTDGGHIGGVLPWTGIGCPMQCGTNE